MFIDTDCFKAFIALPEIVDTYGDLRHYYQVVSYGEIKWFHKELERQAKMFSQGYCACMKVHKSI